LFVQVVPRTFAVVGATMIDRDEIDGQARALGVPASYIQRDYVFGWLLGAIYGEQGMAEPLILKGGNCLRKAYFPNSRYSPDLDFGTPHTLSPERLSDGLNECCRFISARTALAFDLDRTRVTPKRRIDDSLSVWDARVYFNDFYGKPSELFIAVRMDVTEFDRPILGHCEQQLLHPYSDGAQLSTTVHCMRLEEILASKLKCLLQRKHVADFYDLVHWIFFGFNQVDVRSVLDVFLRKTIYRGDPGTAGDLLRSLVFASLRDLWTKYITCAKGAVIDFQEAVDRFLAFLDDVFPAARPRARRMFFSADLRNPLLEAARTQTIARVTYKGRDRLVEPYSLQFKTTQVGESAEYLYVWEREGGSSSPGIRTYKPQDMSRVVNTDESFEAQFPIELAKAGEPAAKATFGRGAGLPRALRPQPKPKRQRRVSTGPVHQYECSHCGKKFRRKKQDSTAREHKDRNGNRCYGQYLVYLGWG
jgi:predicted nucleotidyltransferase component of viral defense system